VLQFPATLHHRACGWRAARARRRRHRRPGTPPPRGVRRRV